MKSSSPSPSSPLPVPKKDLAGVLELIRRMNAVVALPELLTFLTRETARMLQAESTSILIYDPEHCELVAFVTTDGVPIRFDARLGIAGATLTGGEPILVDNAQEDARFYGGVDRFTKKRTRTLMAVPLRCKEGHIIGVFEAINKKGGALPGGI